MLPLDIKVLVTESEAFADLPSGFTREDAIRVNTYHQTIPGYGKTPLCELPELAALLGIKQVLVKDESHRFGLNAFKALGASYAAGCALCDYLGLPRGEMSFAAIKAACEQSDKPLLLVTATDGNHGRAVAWSAKQFGAESLVFMPKGTSDERVENIRALGAGVTVTDKNYDQTVSLASRVAGDLGGILVQDTAWEGYTDIPQCVMSGYLSIAEEIFSQTDEIPTHIFLQAGVGSFAAALAACFVQSVSPAPKIIIVEPNEADCLYRSALNGTLTAVTGDLATVMAGLACGIPSILAWEILQKCAYGFISCDDYYAALGMRILANPIGSDARIKAGESAAAGVGILYEAMRVSPSVRDALKLSEDSRVLFISTEGYTDQASCREILWGEKLTRA